MMQPELGRPLNLLTIAVHSETAQFHIAWMTVIAGGAAARCPDCGTVAGYIVTLSGQHQGADITLDQLRTLWVEWSADLYELLMDTLRPKRGRDVGAIWTAVISDQNTEPPNYGWWVGAADTAFILTADELATTVASCEMLVQKAERHGFAAFNGQHEHVELSERLRAELQYLDLETL